MSQNEQIDPSNSQQSEAWIFYRAIFPPVTGQVSFYGRAPEPVTFTGKAVLVLSEVDGELAALPYLAWQSEQPLDELGGKLLFAGPVTPIKREPGVSNPIELEMQLYYPKLPTIEEVDAVYPQLETLQGRVYWDPAGEALYLRLELDKVGIVAEGGGAVTGFAIEGPATFTEQKAEDGRFLANLTKENRVLHLNFINQSGQSDQSLEALTQRLLKGANQVWQRQGGLQLVALASSRDGSLTTGNVPPRVVGPGEVIEAADGMPVYFRELSASVGGGEASPVDERTKLAEINLDLTRATHNKYLLAHEAGHVFGLFHPNNGTASVAQLGSWCSVMTPGQPNSSRNTNHNLARVNQAVPLFTPAWIEVIGAYGVVPANTAQQLQFFHIIRNFPEDDGSPLARPQPSDWGIKSDVWNLGSNSQPTFNRDTTPLHLEPIRTANNFLFVRLHACQPITNQVLVHLFLVAENQQNGTILFPQLAGNQNPFSINPLIFNNNFRPQPDAPRFRSTPWRIPNGCPTNCWIFAISSSAEDKPQQIEDFIANPNSFTFQNLNDLALEFNNVGLRKLTIQEPVPPSPTPIPT